MVHGIPVQPFLVEDTENTLNTTLFSDECATFNPIRVTGTPRWLAQPGSKRAASVVFSVASETEKTHALQNGLYIAGIKVRTTPYRPYSAKTQCHRCQGFGHDPKTCKRPTRCGICAEKHHTRAHICSVCNNTSTCEHVKCVNCSGNHPSNSSQCETYNAIRG